MADKQSTGAAPNPQDLERVREILFGNMVRDYEERFQVLQRDVGRLQGALDKTNARLAEQERDHSRRLQELRQELRTASDELRAEMRSVAERLTGDKVDKETLGDLLVEMGSQIKGTGVLSSVLEGLLSMDAGERTE